MRTKLTRVLAGLAAIAVASLALFTADAQALPPGSPADGAVTLSPTSGNSSTAITMLPPSGAACQGDSASGGYRWQTFMVDSGVDVGTITYPGGVPTAAGATFIQPMFASGTPVSNKNTAVTTGVLTGIPIMSLNVFAPGFVPAGQYKVGFACSLAGATTRYWVSPITITTDALGGPAQIDYNFGWVPAAPVLGGSLTPGDQTLAGTFTHAASITATTSYLVTAVPTSGPTVTLPLAAGATTFTLAGLVNGMQYGVSVTATNTVGTSAPSNTVNGTPNPAPRPPVTSLVATPGTGSVALSWVAPTGIAPTGYTVGVSPTVAGQPFSLGAGALGLNVTGLAAGTNYTFTVTPTHPAPYVGTSASVSAVPLAAQVITQDITVVRPVGNLVLTQRCGVNGALPAEPASPGFGVLPILPASADQTGIAPTIDPARTIPDPSFNEYPYPVDASEVPNAVYPTHCGLALGIAHLVTTGSVSGQYFAVDGHLNQVSVVDTRDTDAGWVLSGSVSNFTSGGNSFSGNYLGWTPVMTSDSGVTLEGYDQTVVAGGMVAPDFSTGLTTPKVLASAAPNVGLGIAKLDARLKLLIPVTANNGTYTATLTFTVV